MLTVRSNVEIRNYTSSPLEIKLVAARNSLPPAALQQQPPAEYEMPHHILPNEVDSVPLEFDCSTTSILFRPYGAEKEKFWSAAISCGSMATTQTFYVDVPASAHLSFYYCVHVDVDKRYKHPLHETPTFVLYICVFFCVDSHLLCTPLLSRFLLLLKTCSLVTWSSGCSLNWSTRPPSVAPWIWLSTVLRKFTKCRQASVKTCTRSL